MHYGLVYETIAFEGQDPKIFALQSEVPYSYNHRDWRFFDDEDDLDIQRLNASVCKEKAWKFP